MRELLSQQYDLGSREPNIQVWNVNLRGDRSLTLRHFQHKDRPLADSASEAQTCRAAVGLRGPPGECQRQGRHHQALDGAVADTLRRQARRLPSAACASRHPAQAGAHDPSQKCANRSVSGRTAPGELGRFFAIVAPLPTEGARREFH